MSDHIPAAEPASPGSSLPVQLPPRAYAPVRNPSLKLLPRSRRLTRLIPPSHATMRSAIVDHPSVPSSNQVSRVTRVVAPKGAKGLNTIVRENLTQKVGVRTATGEKRMPRIEALVHKALEQAMKGNPRVLFELLKLYAHAVPEEKPAAQEEEKRDEDLSAADRAILAAFTQQISRERGADQ